MSQLGAGNGTSFPTSIDTRTTEINSPQAGKTKARAEVVNDLLAAVVAIEASLGSGSVRRFPILTSDPSAEANTILVYGYSATGVQSIRVMYPDGTTANIVEYIP